VGCRQRFAQRDLVRFVRSARGWQADRSGARAKQAGRGAYLCSAACVRLAARNKRYPGLATAAEEYGLMSSSHEQ
jgi:predicted RNA-binding protein YlxR (DUF448 family)